MQNQNQDLHKLFIEVLADIYNAEKQVVKALPWLIKLASLPDLKEALTKHWNETENQVRRIEKIYHVLDIRTKDHTCKAMEGLIKEADELTGKLERSATMDAAIISACQKIEHYKIASYGTLRSFAQHLDLDSEIIDLLQDTLDEEGAADKKLTKIADGSFFASGVNKEAVLSNSTNHKIAKK